MTALVAVDVQQHAKNKTAGGDDSRRRLQKAREVAGMLLAVVGMKEVAAAAPRVAVFAKMTS